LWSLLSPCNPTPKYLDQWSEAFGAYSKTV
jgi:hypothetical protein